MLKKRSFRPHHASNALLKPLFVIFILILILIALFLFRPVKPVINPKTTLKTPTQKMVKSGFALPVATLEVIPGGLNKIQIFNIQANKGNVSPDKFSVFQNDIVRINFHALDDTYSLRLPDMGLSQTSKTGESRIIEFQAVKTGTFPIVCDNCQSNNIFGQKSENNKVIGEIVVEVRT